MANMADVARAAGVSIATVSHVVNGTRAVRESTRRAVEGAIERLGYAPNTLARSLATANTRTLAVVMSAISNPYFSRVLQGVEAAAVREGYTLLLAESHDDPEHELAAVRTMRERRVDGIALAPSANPARTLEYATEQDVPVVLLDRLVDDRYDQVGPDNAEPVARLVDHLAALGHRRIGMVSGRAGLSTTDERIAGYRAGLRRNDLPCDETLRAGGESETESATGATAALLARERPPSALITANDSMTIGALQALRDARLHVPADIALVAFDDFPWADLFAPRLTAIAQSYEDIGAEAARLLARRIAEPALPAETHRLPSRFVHRESCGCAPAEESRAPA